MENVTFDIAAAANAAIAHQRAVEQFRIAIARGLVTVDAPWQLTVINNERRTYERARELLLSCLNDKQRASYEIAGSFSITKGRGIRERVYRIAEAFPFAMRIDRNFVLHYCVLIPVSGIPIPDLMLAVKMMIESDERRFLRIANIVYKSRNINQERPQWMKYFVP